jgi:hypothetical protein
VGGTTRRAGSESSKGISGSKSGSRLPADVRTEPEQGADLFHDWPLRLGLPAGEDAEYSDQGEELGVHHLWRGEVKVSC